MNFLRPYILQPACEPDDYTYCQNRSAPFNRYKGRGKKVHFCTKYQVQCTKYEVVKDARNERQETRAKNQEIRSVCG